MTDYVVRVKFKSIQDPKPEGFDAELARVFPIDVQQAWTVLHGRGPTPQVVSHEVSEHVAAYLREKGLPEAWLRDEEGGCRPCQPPPKNCHICDKSVWETTTERLRIAGAGIQISCRVGELESMASVRPEPDGGS